jgi:hypothetical protein
MKERKGKERKGKVGMVDVCEGTMPGWSPGCHCAEMDAL